MPLLITILIAKTASWLSQALGRGGGSALPGLIAEKLDPGILAKLAKHLDESVVITGTNGKTTTTQMVAKAAQRADHRVVSNSSGSNLTRGIISALIEQSSWRGRSKTKLGIFEVDEASMPAACDALKPKLIAILNLHRDQLDRYGELDTTARLIGKALRPLKADIWLNADDPLVASLKKYTNQESKVRYFGINSAPTRRLAHDRAADSDHCPVCGSALDYKVNFYSHIGHYACPQGHLSRPKPELVGNLKGEALTIEGISLPEPFTAIGLYNAYNLLGALAVTKSLDIDLAQAAEAFRSAKAAFGRMEVIRYQGRKITILLIKNPTGFNQVIQTFLTKESRPMMIAINDKFADGRDVSWLWDVGFEEIGEGQIVASGIRTTDLGLRLKYAEREVELSESDLLEAFNRLIQLTPEGKTAYVLPTYTAMLELRDRLKLTRFEAQ